MSPLPRNNQGAIIGMIFGGIFLAILTELAREIGAGSAPFDIPAVWLPLVSVGLGALIAGLTPYIGPKR